MASITDLLLSLLVLSPLLLGAADARESEFFSKVSTASDRDVESFEPQARSASPSANFEKGVQGYGLSESQYRPSTTAAKNNPYNTNDNGAKAAAAVSATNYPFKDEFDETPKNTRSGYYSESEKGNSKYYNGDEGRFKPSFAGRGGYNGPHFDNQPSRFGVQNSGEKGGRYGAGRFGGQERQGMSDTRFMYNGMYSLEANRARTANGYGAGSGNRFGARAGTVSYRTQGNRGYNTPNIDSAAAEEEDEFKP